MLYVRIYLPSSLAMLHVVRSMGHQITAKPGISEIRRIKHCPTRLASPLEVIISFDQALIKLELTRLVFHQQTADLAGPLPAVNVHIEPHHTATRCLPHLEMSGTGSPVKTASEEYQ